MASAKDDKQFKYDAGNTLLALREKAGMTQPELAEKIHVEPNSVHRYEKGERQMSLHTAYEASVAFGVPIYAAIQAFCQADSLSVICRFIWATELAIQPYMRHYTTTPRRMTQWKL